MILRIISLLACTAMSILIGVGSYRTCPDPDRIMLAATFVFNSFFAIAFSQWFRPKFSDPKEDEFVYVAVTFAAVMCCGSMWMAEQNSPLLVSLESVIVRF